MFSEEKISMVTEEVFGTDLPKSFSTNRAGVLGALEAAFPIEVIRSKKQHTLTLAVVEKVMVFLAKHEKDTALCAEVRKYLEALSLVVEAYEREAFPKVGATADGVEMLKYLMELHRLKQDDFQKEIGAQANVSAILNRKEGRNLTVKQIGALAKRFKVSPAAFF